MCTLGWWLGPFLRFLPLGSDFRGSKRLKTLQLKGKMPGDTLGSSVTAAAVAAAVMLVAAAIPMTKTNSYPKNPRICPIELAVAPDTG